MGAPAVTPGGQAWLRYSSGPGRWVLLGTVAAGLTGNSCLHPEEFTAGFHRASLIAAGLCVIGGVLAAATIRNPRPTAAEAAPASCPLHCGLDGPPARVTLAASPASRPEAPG